MTRSARFSAAISRVEIGVGAGRSPCGAQLPTGAGPRSSSGTATPIATAAPSRLAAGAGNCRDRAVQPAAGHPWSAPLSRQSCASKWLRTRYGPATACTTSSSPAAYIACRSAQRRMQAVEAAEVQHAVRLARAGRRDLARAGRSVPDRRTAPPPPARPSPRAGSRRRSRCSVGAAASASETRPPAPNADARPSRAERRARCR